MPICGTARAPIANSCKALVSAPSKLLTRTDARVWVGEVAGNMVGFLSMIVGSFDPVEHRPGGAELPRIYILGSAQRVGLGRLLVDAAVEQAAAEGLSYVWLDVMASADRARHAYAKWGFHELGSKRFERTVKVGLSDMVALAKETNAPHARL